MSDSIRVLFAENEAEADPIRGELRAGGFEIDETVVRTVDALRAQLDADSWHVVVAALELEDTATLSLLHTEAAHVPVVLFYQRDEEGRIDGLEHLARLRPDDLASTVNQAVGRRARRRARQDAETAFAGAADYHRAVLQAMPDSLIHLHRDGTVIEFTASRSSRNWVDASDVVDARLDDIVSTGLAETLTRTMKAVLADRGRVERVEFSVLTGDQLSHFEGTFVAAAADEVVGVIRDITERRDLEGQMRAAQRMESIARFAGGIAHDFNNVLTGVYGYADLLMDEFDEGQPIHHDLSVIRDSAERGSRLTKQLLTFSRRQAQELEVLDLNRLLERLEPLLRRLVSAQIELQLVPGDSLAPVEADLGQLEQVVMNLLVNGSDAMPAGGLLRIETANVDVVDGEMTAVAFGDVPAGQYVVLSVSDTGIGMDEETRRRIFEPFFTTKSEADGTGLGLSTVFGIVRQTGGFMRVESVPGDGTEFQVLLPASDATTTKPPQLISTNSVAADGTIVVAEDDEFVRSSVQRVLGRAGYRVLGARDGAELRDVVDRHDGSIDVLLADVVMPNFAPREAASRLRREHPELRTIFMSGYSPEALPEECGLTPADTILQKPFTPEALLEAVARVVADDA